MQKEEEEMIDVPNETKREMLSEQITDCLNGDNLLGTKLNKKVSVKMSVPMRALWLDRLMKEPTGSYVNRCMMTMFAQPTVTSLWPLEMQIKEERHPELELFFYHFTFPYEGDEKWENFKLQHKLLLFQGQANNENIKNSYLQKMPLDVGFLTYTFKEKNKQTKRTEFMRFIVYEPLAENTKGAVLQVSFTDAGALGIL